MSHERWPSRTFTVLSPGCISYFLVEAEIFAFRIAATLVLLEEFVRSEACQRKVTHDEDEDYPPHRPNGSDEVLAVLGVVHAF